MGLDNGIYIKGYRKKPFYVKDALYDQEEQIDLAYWRRHYGLRHDILNMLDLDYNSNDSKISLNIEQIKKIRSMIKSITFSKKEYIDSCGDYWDYNFYSILRGIRQMINLTWAIREIKNNPEVEVIWYDSY